MWCSRSPLTSCARDSIVISTAAPEFNAKIIPMDFEKNFTENDLTILEQRIDELIDTMGQLKYENSNLRQQQEQLVIEKSALVEKTEMAKTRVEAMITRLRSLELG